MISTDTKIFEEGSAVRARQAEYAKGWDEVHIIVFAKRNAQFPITNNEVNHKSQDPNSRELKEASIAPNCFVYPTRSWSKFLYSLDASRLGSFIIPRRKITDITCQDPFLTSISGVALKKEFQIPLEIQVHTDIGSPNFTYTFGNRIRKVLALTNIPQADSVRVVSERIRSYLEKTQDPRSKIKINSKFKIQNSKPYIEVRPIFVDTDKIKDAQIIEKSDLHKKYPQFEKIVLMASRLEKEKSIELAINSWPMIIIKYPKAGLIIVGSGSLEHKLKTLISRLGLQTSVIIESWANFATLCTYYKTADLFLNTSLFEGYGMTLVEAQAARCKIVSTDVGVAKEVGARIVGWNKKEVSEAIVEILEQNVKIKN